MKTFIEIKNLDKVVGIGVMGSYENMWTLDKVVNGRDVYKFHFTSENKGNRVIELKREMHDVGLWKISGFANFDLISMQTLKNPTSMISVFSNLLD
jgi:hypothetical protein